VNPLKASQPVGASLAFLGIKPRHSDAARLAGLHRIRQGVFRASLSRTHPVADHRHGSGVDGDERGRERDSGPESHLRKKANQR